MDLEWTEEGKEMNDEWEDQNCWKTDELLYMRQVNKSLKKCFETGNQKNGSSFLKICPNTKRSEKPLL